MRIVLRFTAPGARGSVLVMASQPCKSREPCLPYQSIDDTIVQLFIPQTSVLMTRADRFNRDAHDQEHKENETRKY
jgi:hypothetical protein